MGGGRAGTEVFVKMYHTVTGSGRDERESSTRRVTIIHKQQIQHEKKRELSDASRAGALASRFDAKPSLRGGEHEGTPDARPEQRHRDGDEQRVYDFRASPRPRPRVGRRARPRASARRRQRWSSRGEAPCLLRSARGHPATRASRRGPRLFSPRTIATRTSSRPARKPRGAGPRGWGPRTGRDAIEISRATS